MFFDHRIRENITPRGDGNPFTAILIAFAPLFIRENITPRGDGNRNDELLQYLAYEKIRENITPRGDGNETGIVYLDISESYQ